MLSDPEGLDRFLEEVFSCAPGAISVKTRLGRKDRGEFPRLLEIFNRYPITELTVHCRVRDDFYRENACEEAFALPLEQSKNPVCYNGDLVTLPRLRAFQERYPQTPAVMLGRGLVADPALARRWAGGPPVDRRTLQAYNEELFEAYADDFGSRRNALGRMKEIWFYQISLFQRAEKYEKKLKKTTDPAEYQQLAARIFGELELRSEGAQPTW